MITVVEVSADMGVPTPALPDFGPSPVGVTGAEAVMAVERAAAAIREIGMSAARPGARFVDATSLAEPVTAGATVIRTVASIPYGTTITLGGEQRVTSHPCGTVSPFTITLALDQAPWPRPYPVGATVTYDRERSAPQRSFRALGSCPGCATVDFHLLEGGTAGWIGRECLACGRTWSETLLWGIEPDVVEPVSYPTIGTERIWCP